MLFPCVAIPFWVDVFYFIFFFFFFCFVPLAMQRSSLNDILITVWQRDRMYDCSTNKKRVDDETDVSGFCSSNVVNHGW